MAFRTRDEDEYTRRVINCEWSFEVNQERIFYLFAKIVFSLHLTTVIDLKVTDVIEKIAVSHFLSISK